jgi:hypothetical protein
VAELDELDPDGGAAGRLGRVAEDPDRVQLDPLDVAQPERGHQQPGDLGPGHVRVRHVDPQALGSHAPAAGEVDGGVELRPVLQHGCSPIAV